MQIVSLGRSFIGSHWARAGLGQSVEKFRAGSAYYIGFDFQPEL